VSGYAVAGSADVFGPARVALEREIAWLDGVEAGGLGHADLEREMLGRGRELQRLLFQAHLEVRAVREVRLGEVTGVDGHPRRWAARGRERDLDSVFGVVNVERIAYRRRAQSDLHPLDAALNLPSGQYSYGICEQVARAAALVSFEHAQVLVAASTGVTVPRRQLGNLVIDAAGDFEAFYNSSTGDTDTDTDTDTEEKVLVIQCDGKGVVMRPEALRLTTAQAPTSRKLATRLSKGEKNGRKRMAEVAAVYDATPAPRTAADIITLPAEGERVRAQGPKISDKWLTASVAKDTALVIAEAFDQAERRDPAHTRTWVALVDGNNHQIARIKAEAEARGIEVTIVVDFVHVIEYVWGAAWCFFPQGDPKAEAWVGGMMRAVLDGHASRVAGIIRRKATYAELPQAQRHNADKAADYLLAKAPYLDYPTALTAGWPIATGVIEGACRHLIMDRMDITGARWGLDGAEAVLRLRALTTNGHFDDYWRFHVQQEHQRVHANRYLNQTAPT